MLILTRPINSIFTINDNIEVIILGIQGRQVKVGIKAPIEIPIVRNEAKKKLIKDKTDGNR